MKSEWYNEIKIITWVKKKMERGKAVSQANKKRT